MLVYNKTNVLLQSNTFDLNFAVDDPDVLENFDFDSFLNYKDDYNDFGDFGKDFIRQWLKTCLTIFRFI